ncbi:MAG: CRISPR-associated helicase Cas3' [Eubacteriales bacterium]
MEKIAHIRYAENGEAIIQTLSEHLHNTANYAAMNLSSVGLFQTGRLGGLLHDVGKGTHKFEAYITAAAKGENVSRGSVNHTFAGVILLYDTVQPKNAFEKLTLELVACAIGSHHGLFDCIDPNGNSGFDHRIEANRDEIAYEEAKSNFFAECASREEILDLFTAAVAEVAEYVKRIRSYTNTKSEISFAFGALERLMQSALMDADRRDTAEFYGADRREETAGQWTAPLEALENRLRQYCADSPINIARSAISDLCRDAAYINDHGIYRLNVPTGAGKTLSALRFALTNAEKFGKRHIFYIAPLLTVLEQNADAIREAVGDPSLVLEHHSNIVKTDMQQELCDRYELLTESWDAPIIVTTLVQFLNTLFSGKTSSVRRMHTLANSVIVMDEIQSLPHKTVEVTNLMLNFLAYSTGATVVLCSATQPCLEKINHPLILSPNPDLVPYRRELWAPFDRVKTVNLCRKGRGYSAADTADLVCEKIRGCDSVLLICNTKRTAFLIFTLLQKRSQGDVPFRLLHLSASMCQKHRRKVLSEIGKPPRSERLVCVTTQLVEAGVDLSFACVIRMLAGVDNIAQAAGRCNRSNEYGKICEVDLINVAPDIENLNHLAEIREAKNAAEIVLDKFGTNETTGTVDLLCDDAVQTYYRNFFLNVNTDYPVPRLHTNLFDLLSVNQVFGSYRKENSNSQTLRQAFKSAGESFGVFEESTTSVIVPYDDEAKTLIGDLFSKRAEKDLGYVRQILTRVKPYTVSVYDGMLRMLRDRGLVYGDEIVVLAEGVYDPEVGLCLQRDTDMGLLEM